MASGVSFILHCIMEHQFIFSATYDSQEDRKGNIMLQKLYVFFQERNRFVNCSDPGASFYVLGQTG